MIATIACVTYFTLMVGALIYKSKLQQEERRREIAAWDTLNAYAARKLGEEK